MAHMIDKMAYKGETPWHGLGVKLPANQTIDQWRIAAGLDWSCKRSPGQYEAETGIVLPNGEKELITMEGDSHILYRSDNLKQLGIVSPNYRIVQPHTIMEFFRDLVGTGGMEIETAGSLDDGKKIWALAKTSRDFRLFGEDQEQILGYVLLSTSFDGSLATRYMHTSVRVVCNNTLQMAVGERTGFAVPHSSDFSVEGAKIDLGLIENQWQKFEKDANELARFTLGKEKALAFITDLLQGKDKDGKTKKLEDIATRGVNQIGRVLDLFAGAGIGSDTKAANGTMWGLLNAVTQYVDHEQGRTDNNRFKSGQFGEGAKLKNLAYTQALKMAA